MTLQTSPAFEAALPYTLEQEGGNSDDPHDPGGRTHKGIIQREYDAYRKAKGLPLQSAYLMSDAEVREIYWTSYWLPHCPSLPPGLDLSYFDNAVNEGPRRATILLQKALGLTPDGIWGDKTQNAVAAITNVPAVITKMSAYRQAFYEGLGTFKYFGHGWTRRTKEIETASLNLAQEGQDDAIA